MHPRLSENLYTLMPELAQASIPTNEPILPDIHIWFREWLAEIHFKLHIHKVGMCLLHIEWAIEHDTYVQKYTSP